MKKNYIRKPYKKLLGLFFFLLLLNVKAQTPATALNFDGPVNSSYDYITVTDDPSLDFTNSFTFETWVNFDFIARNNDGWDWQCLFAKSRYNASYGLMYLSDTGFPRGITFYHAGFGTGATTYQWPTIASNTWYHIAVTLSPTKATIYVDGVEVMSQTGTGSLTPNNDPLFIGANNGAGDPYPLDGTLEETRFWNVARTQAEIQADMMRQLGGSESNLVLQFSYNQGNIAEDNTAITMVTDNSTEGNHGTLNQFALTGAASNFVDGSGSGVVSGQEQTITFGALADKTTDDVPFQLTATSDSGLPITYTSSNLAVATISGDMLTIVGAGTTTITASQPGNATYQSAMDVSQVQLVTLGMTNPCDPGNDNFAPSFTNINGNTSQTVALDAMGTITITPESFGITAVDNCTASPVLSLSQTDFTCNDIGNNTIQLTVTDDQNNSDVMDVTVVVQDTTDPVIDLGGSSIFTVDLDENGEVDIDIASLGIVVTDNCGTPQVTLSTTSFNCNNIRATPGNFVLVTATDAQNNTTRANIFVTVRDNTAPIINQCASPFEVTLDTSGRYTLTADELGTGISDNCSFSTSIDIETLTAANIGDNTVTMTATDAAGNANNCSTTVTVNFGGCPSDITVNSDPSLCGAIVDYGSWDNITSGLPSGSVFPVGTTTVAFEVQDENNQTIQCSFNVIVNDVMAPQFFVVDQSVDVSAGDVTLAIDDFIGLETGDPSYVVSRVGTFAPATLSGSQTGVTLDDDEVSGNLPIGFDFDFFGVTYSEFYISSNGFISFLNDSDEDGCCNGASLPDNGDDIRALIAYAWSDLDPTNAGVISYETIGMAPNRTLIIDFDNVSHFEGAQWSVTSQIKLFEMSNVIEIHSASIIPVTVPGEDYVVTQGIENAAQDEAFYLSGRNAGANWGTTNEYLAFIPSINSVFDTCGVDTVTISQTTFTCSDIGDISVTITATDVNSNVSTQNVTVTVTTTDTTAPVISLTGDNPQEIILGDAYTELGATTDDGSTVVINDTAVNTNQVGSYSVTYNASDLSCNDAVEMIRTVNVVSSLSLEDTLFAKGISIYPNPVNEIITIQSDHNVMDQIKIIDISGRVIKKTTNKVGSMYQMNLSGISKGVYFLQITSEGKEAVKRIVKE